VGGKMKLISENCYKFTNEKTGIHIHVYLSPSLYEDITDDQSINQLYNAALLPGVVSPIIGMPDIHTGYGLPIGGVMATDFEKGVVSAGAVGMDINCGVRLLSTKLIAEEIDKNTIQEILRAILKKVPTGVGKSSREKNLREPCLDSIAARGVKHFIDKGYGRIEDQGKIEDGGCMEGADTSAVPLSAVKRSHQLGTIGGGNHFIEIGRIGKVFDEGIAAKFGLYDGAVYVLIHTGSRGLGHEICTVYSDIMWRNSNKNGTRAPEKGLACAPVFSQDGQMYLKAMACAANYAFCNRQIITHLVREAFTEVIKMPERDIGLDIVYDVAHNIAKDEVYQNTKLLVHRKGATRALPPGHEGNPAVYMETGHPAIIPGSMGTASYVVLGTDDIHKTFCSVSHGAGRVMSRKKARQEFTTKQFQEQMKNVITTSRDIRSLLDEAPLAYKNIDDVIFTLVDAGLTKPIVRLKPLGVLKGEGDEA
jgi:tRNA-splicing ligase RtcB